jgi:outer membrane protein, multidrug efflux system
VNRAPRFAITIVVALSACRAPERVDADKVVVPPPTLWDSVHDSGDVDADWWRQLGDPDLDAAIARTLQYNHDLQAAQSRLAAAAAQARLAGAPLSPQVNVGLDGNRQRTVFVGFPFGDGGPLSSTFKSFGVNLNASWEIDVWNRIGAAKGAALADLHATAEDLRGLRQSLAGQTAKAYYAAVEARQQITLATTTVASYHRTESQVEARFRRGVRSALDLRLSRSRRMTARSQQAQWEERFENAVRQLEVLQGRYPNGKSSIPETLPEQTAPIPAGIPADIVRRRPDLIAAERRLVAAGFRVDEAQASLYPSLSLSGQIGTTSDGVRDLLDLDFLIWNLAANLVAPVIDGGSRRAQRDLAIARESEAIAGFAKTVLNAYNEVETLLASRGFVHDREQSLAAASTESRAAQNLSEDRYRRGLGDYTTVLEAQRSALVIQAQLLTARRQLLDLRVDLHLALGGGFEPTRRRTSEEDPRGPR